MGIDWTKPIEAYNFDGEIEPMEYNGKTKNGERLTLNSPGRGESNTFWYEDGEDFCFRSPWRIRNVIATPTPQDRAWEFVKSIVDRGYIAGDRTVARSILADAELVDGDAAEADALMADMIYSNDHDITRRRAHRIVLTAIKRGRKLAQENSRG